MVLSKARCVVNDRNAAAAYKGFHSIRKAQVIRPNGMLCMNPLCLV